MKSPSTNLFESSEPSDAVLNWVQQNGFTEAEWTDDEASWQTWLGNIGQGAATGAVTGTAAGPWGALIGGLAGAGLGAVQTALQPAPPRPIAPPVVAPAPPVSSRPLAAPTLPPAFSAPAFSVAPLPTASAPVAVASPPTPAPAPPQLRGVDVQQLVPLLLQMLGALQRPTPSAVSPVPAEHSVGATEAEPAAHDHDHFNLDPWASFPAFVLRLQPPAGTST